MLRRFLASPIDWFILFIPIILLATGVITIYTITFADYQFSLASDQLIFIGIGLVGMLALMFTDYRIFSPYSWLMYLICIGLLLMLVPPLSNILPFVDTVYGATRWINLGFFQLQPSEVFKFLGIIVAAAFLAKHYRGLDLKSGILYIFLIGLPLFLVIIEPNLGTTIILFIIFGTMFLSANPPKQLIYVIIALMLIAMPVVYSSLKPYQKTRVQTFLSLTKKDSEMTDEEQEKKKKEYYNVEQARIAVGSGGLTGRGFGQGSQTVLNFLPVAHSDFIFAGFAEAMGFAGSLTLIILYTLLIWRIISVAQISADPFGRYIAIGIAAKFFIQIVVHVGMNLGIMPVTGIPLPFMSYGGTAAIIDMACVGLVESIHIRHKKFFFQ